jgi:M6 family metalloprotease-like protein
MFFNTGGTLLSLTDFWRENSYGLTTAVGNLAPGTSGGWYTLDQVYTQDHLPQIRAAAIQAADPDVDFRQYSRIFIIVNGMEPITSGGGWGTLSCGLLSSADGNFNASTSWMRAPSFSDNIRGAHVINHEAGHNLGLHHSNSRDFGSDALGAPGVAGVVDEYNDVFAEMGRSFGHYAAPHKYKLGWLTTRVQTVTGSGSFSIQPTETGGSVQALRIRRGTDNANWLWVEYRQPVTIYDTKLAAPFVIGLPPNQTFYLDAADSHIYSGALIHYEDATTGNYSHLIDFTPESRTGSTNPLVPNDWLDPVLFGSWTDSYTGVSITTSNPTASSLTVNVIYGTGPCVESNPSVSISPPNPSTKRGQNVTYTLTVTNNDTTTCFSKAFQLGSSQPPGWSTSFSQNPVTIAAGSSVAVSMTKIVPSNEAFATHPVDASATSGAYSGSGNASVTVKPGK